MTRSRPPAVLSIALAGPLSACGGQADSIAQPDPATFDLALVQANFLAECEDPIVVDELFCEQVDIDGMSADGAILNVPTTLNAAATDRAEVICQILARVHVDGDTGEDPGTRRSALETATAATPRPARANSLVA